MSCGRCILNIHTSEVWKLMVEAVYIVDFSSWNGQRGVTFSWLPYTLFSIWRWVHQKWSVSDCWLPTFNFMFLTFPDLRTLYPPPPKKGTRVWTCLGFVFSLLLFPMWDNKEIIFPYHFITAFSVLSVFLGFWQMVWDSQEIGLLILSRECLVFWSSSSWMPSGCTLTSRLSSGQEMFSVQFHMPKISAFPVMSIAQAEATFLA